MKLLSHTHTHTHTQNSHEDAHAHGVRAIFRNDTKHRTDTVKEYSSFSNISEFSLNISFNTGVSHWCCVQVSGDIQ